MVMRLALVGRPNVGKSTLFNRLVGKKLAIVHDEPGVTRDWKEAPAHLSDLSFVAIDTAGLEETAAGGDVISKGMRQATEAALQRCDVILFVIDGREGVTQVDRTLAKWLRKQGRPILLAANKCESKVNLDDVYGLGLGNPIAMSAAHGGGMIDLYNALQPHVDAAKEDGEELDDESDLKPIRLALVGRPNVGKSTLMNAFLGEERAMVSPIAGTTRDTIAERWEYKGQQFRLVDTAGMRRRAKIDETLEQMAVAETLRIIRLAEVVVLVLDGNAPLEAQELAIADLVMREGRALVIALNKWDSVEHPSDVLKAVEKKLHDSLQQAKGIAVVPISALKKRKLDKLIEAVLETHKVWDTRVTTGQLNRWLEAMIEANQPPMVKGRRVKIRYMTQRKARPPTFVIFCGTHATPPESYLRYLSNGLRERFNIWGVPIRIELKKGRNPYEDEKKE